MSAIASRNRVDFEEITPELVRELAGQAAAPATQDEAEVEKLLRQTRADLDAVLEGRMRTLAARYDAKIATYHQKVQDNESKLENLKGEWSQQQKKVAELEGKVKAFKEWAKSFETI